MRLSDRTCLPLAVALAACSGSSGTGATADAALPAGTNDGGRAVGADVGPAPAGPDGAVLALVPAVDGDWWTIAGDPDLGALSDPGQQPVDFGVWQAADGTWQLWSCIRFTRAGGNTRLFYRWEGQHPTDHDWKPGGIALQADTAAGEAPGGLQAPYVTRVAGTYHMFYGGWGQICHATSDDGKTFVRKLGADGRSEVFSDGAGSRDPMLLPLGDGFQLYYTTDEGADFARATRDLTTFGPRVKVAEGGSAGIKGVSAECPFVVHLDEASSFFLFRTQVYGQDAITRVYRSGDPLDFGLGDDSHLVTTLPVAAPEIFLHDGQWYIAALLPTLKGIRMAKLKWTGGP